MTLAEVLQRMKDAAKAAQQNPPPNLDPNVAFAEATAYLAAARWLEHDPEFTLPERTEALAKEWAQPVHAGSSDINAHAAARRLYEVLNPPKKAP